MLGNAACRGHEDGFVTAQGKDGFAMGRACGFEPLLLEVEIKGQSTLKVVIKGKAKCGKLFYHQE